MLTNDWPGQTPADAGPAWVATFTGTAPVLAGGEYGARRLDRNVLPILCQDVVMVSAVTGRTIADFQYCDTAPTA